MNSMFTSLPFLKALMRQQGVPSDQDQDDDDSNPLADQFDGSSTAAWADPSSAQGASAQGNGGPSAEDWADPAAAQGNGGQQNASAQPNPSTPGGAATANGQGRPPRLYAVLYTYGNNSGDQDFKNSAFTRADDIRHSPDFDPQKDNVWVYGVRTKDDFKNVLENLGNYEDPYGKVEQLSVFSHGGPQDGPAFHKQTPKGWEPDFFRRDEWGGLKQINFSPTATADLRMCHTAEPDNGYAQDFADAQGVPTRGFADTVFSSDPVNKVRGYKQGGTEYLLGSGGNWVQRNILGYRPQQGYVFLPRPSGKSGTVGGGKGGGGGAGW